MRSVTAAAVCLVLCGPVTPGGEAAAQRGSSTPSAAGAGSPRPDRSAPSPRTAGHENTSAVEERGRNAPRSAAPRRPDLANDQNGSRPVGRTGGDRQKAFDDVFAGAPELSEDAVSFFDTPIPERRILLVLDHSRSMLSKAGRQTRVNRLRQEADALFDRLTEGHYLDVHCFNDRLAVWRRKLVECSDENVDQARAFLARQRPRGKTATYDALHSALVEASDQGVQRIIFLTDGEPTLGTIVEPVAILRQLKRENRSMQVPIDVLAFDTARYPHRRQFLNQLAADHGGRFVPLD